MVMDATAGQAPRRLTILGATGSIGRSTADLIRIISTIHDQLLSTIAAFIGHVHAHSRASHSSSFAYLIDMTRETIEKVREVLVVVDVTINVSPAQWRVAVGGGGRRIRVATQPDQSIKQSRVLT